MHPVDTGHHAERVTHDRDLQVDLARYALPRPLCKLNRGEELATGPGKIIIDNPGGGGETIPLRRDADADARSRNEATVHIALKVEIQTFNPDITGNDGRKATDV